MNLTQLRYFVRVAEMGSFSKAAIELDVAQPALSRQVRLLETDLRVTLLQRTGRGVLLTDAGKRLYEHAVGFLQLVAHAREDLSANRDEATGRIVVGLPPSMGRMLTLPLVDAFKQHLPKARLAIVEGLSAHIVEWISTGRVDLGLVHLRGARRITLTGTPVENRLDELWSQMHFLNPGLLGGRKDFDERYARPFLQGNAEVAEHLRLRIAPFVLRRRKAEVAPELPARTELVLHVALSPEERALYDAVAAATRAEVLEQLESGGGVMAALEALLRLRQACCHPRLLPGQQLEQSAKLELLVDRLETCAADATRRSSSLSGRSPSTWK